MDSTSIADVRTGVVSIIQEFAEVYELFKKWRKGRAGKKAVGQEECETSLHEGKTTIEGTFNRLSLQHGARFDSGDSKDSPIASSWRCANTLTRKIPGQHNQHSKEIPRRCRRRIDKFWGREGRKERQNISNCASTSFRGDEERYDPDHGRAFEPNPNRDCRPLPSDGSWRCFASYATSAFATSPTTWSKSKLEPGVAWTPSRRKCSFESNVVGSSDRSDFV
jgi:hypothetical protein